MPARIRELFQPNRTSNFAKVNKVNSSNRRPVHVLSRKTWLLVQPSSAAAERVFSLLQNSFSQRQSSSLEDYIETSLMLQYNR